MYIGEEIYRPYEDVILEWGKNLIRFEQDERVEEMLDSWIIHAQVTRNGEVFKKEVTLKDIGFRVGGDKLWSDPERRRAECQRRCDLSGREEARQLAYGGLLNKTFTYNRASGLTLGNAELFPGMRVTVKGVTANPLCNGEYIVYRVKHWLDWSGFVTGFGLKRNSCENEKKISTIEREHLKAVMEREPRPPKRERRPEIVECHWEKDKVEIKEANVGDTVMMVVSTSDIPDKAKVEMSVEEYDERGNTRPIEKRYVAVDYDRAKALYEIKEPLEYQLAAFYGYANLHGNVLRVKAEFSNLQWLKDGAEIKEALVDDEVTLVCGVKNIPEGGEVKVAVWEHDDDNEHDHLTDLTGTVKGGKVEIPWKVIYMEDNDDSTSAAELAEKGYTLPEYHFIAEYRKFKSTQSPVMKVYGKIDINIQNKFTRKLASKQKYTIYFADGSSQKGTSGENGNIMLGNLLIGEKIIVFHNQGGENNA